MILCLSDLWPPFPGGAERLMFNLARDLMRRGHVVQVLTGYEHARQFDGPPVVSRSIGVFDDHARGARIVHRAIHRLRPAVILTHHLYAYEFAPELFSHYIPVVQVVLHTGRIKGIAFAVYISEWTRDQVDPEPHDLVITPPAFADVVADRHGDHIGIIKPLPHKGIELFYEVAARFPDRRFLVLRGEWQDLEVIRQLPNVTFMEPVADIRDFYAQCRVVLMPSISEDAGTVAQEAALNGLPCISSDAGGLVETNGGGIRLPPDDLGAWVLAIELLDNPDVRAAVVARQDAHFAATNQDRRLEEFATRISQLHV